MRSTALLLHSRRPLAPRPSNLSASLLLLLRPSPASGIFCARARTLRTTAGAPRVPPSRPPAFGARLRSTTASVLPSAPPMSEPVTSVSPLASGAEGSDAAATLSQLRAVLSARGVDAFVVPSDDCHLSEYVAGAFERRRFLTGFGGSAGTAVVETAGGGRVWTDSRYFEQAAAELDGGAWVLMRQGEKGVPTLLEYLAEKCGEQAGYQIGIDPSVHPSSFVRELVAAVSPQGGTVTELDENENPVDAVWPDRPALPATPFRVHPFQYAGASVAEKLSLVSAEMAARTATLAVFAALDDVAYLLNLRAADVACCPVGTAYCTVGRDGTATLYCDADAKIAPGGEVAAHLAAAGVGVRAYGAVADDVAAHADADAGHRVWLDTSSCNHALARRVPADRLVDAQTAVQGMKAVKNAAEIDGMVEAHLRDGVAMAEFMGWLEAEVRAGGTVSEVEIHQILTAARARQAGFLEPSFASIAGVGPNGAVVHYTATDGPDLRHCTPNVPLLLDSGGQYACGTTDVTRTWHFGTPGAAFGAMYTRVLRGHIALDTAVWPEGTPGFVLDAFARQHLWRAGADYGHGTGHGVGAALNVHEGPMGISRKFENQEPLKEGMVLSNEPGYYVPGEYGIRIENLVLVRRADVGTTGGKKFFKFEKLTMIPIQTKGLVNVDDLTEGELDWIDDYHQEVWEKVGARMADGTIGKEWLRRNCDKIRRTHQQ